MSRLDFPSKKDLTKKRHNIDVLLKRAIKGNLSAKKKLLDEYGIKIYSTSEIDEYVRCKGRGKIKSLPLGKINSGSKRQPIKAK